MNKPMPNRFSITLAITALSIILCSVAISACAAESPDDGKLRIIAFGAHPDDCEIRAGGVAAMWAAKGHHVKFVSTTNGDIGHFKMAGGALAQRRKRKSKPLQRS